MITSLVNDLQAFLDAGYEVRKLCPIDQFPRTGNIETVVQLINQNAKAKHHVNIGVDAEDYYRIKDSEKKKGR